MADKIVVELPEFEEGQAHEGRAAFEYAAKALRFMAANNLSPLPRNYAVWYYYVVGGIPELREEMNRLQEGAGVTEENITEYLYPKYASDGDNPLVKDAAANTQGLLDGILRSVSDFGEATGESTNEIHTHITQLSQVNDQAGLATLASKIAHSAGQLSDTTLAMNEKLEASRGEVHELKKQLEEMARASQKDFLTGIYNRKALDEAMVELIELSYDEGTPLSLLMIDIDHFKMFNDNFGHQVGDQVIKMVGASLTNSVKGQDVVARYGGEEFCIILPDTPLKGAMVVAETIRKKIAARQLKRKETGDNYGVVTVSAGVAQLRPADTPESILSRADAALYVAKREGRNCVRVEDAR